jgi:hypothetical protein
VIIGVNGLLSLMSLRIYINVNDSESVNGESVSTDDISDLTDWR